VYTTKLTQLCFHENTDTPTGLGTSSAEKVFGVNFERLVTLKRQFDPENVFKTGHDLLPGVQVAARLAVGPERVTSSLFLTRGRNVATVA